MSGMKNLVNSATRGLFAALLASSVVLYTFCPSAPSEAEAIPTAPEEAFQLRAANRDPVEGHWQQVAAERKSEGWWQENTHLWIDVSTKEELQRITRTVQAVDAPGESRATSKQQLGSRWTLVEFYATWCPACRRAYPHMCELAGDARLNQQLQFVRVNIDMARAWLPSMDLPGVPWIQVYDPHGRLQGSFAAVPDEDVLPQLEACLLAPSVPTDPNVTRTDAGEPVQHPSQDDDAPAWVGTAPGAHREYNERAATEKARFLEKYGSTYGYNGRIDELYAKEIGSRMAQSEHYLDYTGSSLYSNSQLREVMEELQGAVYGNPHSENPSSERSFAALEKMRGAVLDWLHADPGEYQVVFTRSCTDALKLVGENFPWTPTSHFKYLTANHNSVLGIRAYARMHDADFQALDEDEVEDWLAKTDSDCHAGRGDNDMQQLAAAALGTADDMSEAGVGATGPAYSLFAYPAEENFAGVKLPLDWVDRVHNKSSPGRHEWKVLLDAAAYVPTQPLDLRRVHPNFVTISFYKVFGYPTGLGALVINTEDAQLLHKSYFGGGSTAVATAHEDLAELKCHPAERLEDGTVAFLDIVALQAGLNMVDHLGGMGAVQQHVQALTDYGYERLSGLHHSNGAPLLRVYGKHARPDHSQVQGGIFNFLVLDPEGAAVSYRQVQRESAKAGLHIRTGCHCNPGACYGTLGIRDDEIRILAGQKQGCADDIEWLKVRREERQGRARQADGAAALVHGPANTDDFSVALAGAEEDLQAGGGTTMLLPLGSVRASLGYMSTFEDVDALASWLQATYTDRPA